MRSRQALLAILATLVLLPGCGGTGSQGSVSEGAPDWRSVPPSPLNPRELALGFWSGREVLVVGGSDAPPCPPGASCVPPEVPPLADGAAYDPEAKTWRGIADSPVPFDWAEAVVIGSTAYLWIPGSPGQPEAERAFLAYSIAEDHWEELEAPMWGTERDDYHGIVAAGDGLVLYPGSDEQGERPDLLYDPAANVWSELPPDPLSPSFDRSYVPSGSELVLFDHELVPNPGSEEPTLTRAAALDLATGSWRRLPDSEILASGPWFADGQRLVNPMLGGADGGDVNGWGRTYPYGGIFHPETGMWSPLPDAPEGEDEFSAGVLTESGGHYVGHSGWVLDTTRDSWLELPQLDTEELVTGRTVVAAGEELFVFGGVRWSGTNSTLLSDAHSWSPHG